MATTTSLLLLSLLSLLIMTATTTAADPLSLRVMTFNIRYAAPGDTYEKPWSVRGPLVIDRVSATVANATSSAAVVVIGMQEVLHDQLTDILAGLGEEWLHIGTGRDDGVEAGEYCPILYRPANTTLLASTQKWLSPTPDVPSYWPGAGSRRYVVAAVFEDRATGARFVAANTHLDNASAEARAAGVAIALKVVRDLVASQDQDQDRELPVVLTGDFNSEPGDGAYEAVVADGALADAYERVTEGNRLGPFDTYTGFVPAEIPDVAARIDFAWVGVDAWDVVRYEVLDNVVGGVYISDHRPVVADISLRT